MKIFENILNKTSYPHVDNFMAKKPSTYTNEKLLVLWMAFLKESIKFDDYLA